MKCATETDTTFNAPDLEDAIEYDRYEIAEATENAIDYILGDERIIHDVMAGEYGNNDRLFFLISMIVTWHGSIAERFVTEFKLELTNKVQKLIDARIEIELENL